MTAILTAVNLFMALVCTGVGIAKVVAVRRDTELTLKITALVLLFAGMIFFLTLPVVYRRVGIALSSPSVATLMIDTATLVCVGLAHLLTQLWHPRRRERGVLRRTISRWVLFYAAAIVIMAVLFFEADLSGPAHPLQFVVAYGHVPEVFALQIVYLTALSIAVVVTVRQCGGLAAPGNPGLDQSVRMFALAVSLDLAKAACTLLAMLSAVSGFHRLNFLAEFAWVPTNVSGFAASYGLASLALASRRAETRDCDTLEPLWALVVVRDDDDHPDNDESGQRTPWWRQWCTRLAGWWRRWRASLAGWDVRFRLLRLLVEIRDGEAILSPWMSSAPSEAVARAFHEVRELVDSGRSEDEQAIGELAAHLDLNVDTVRYLISTGVGYDDEIAAQAAATLGVASHARAAFSPPLSADDVLEMLPGEDVPAAREREHLVNVARHLQENPLVDAVVARAAAARAHS
ncbi:hypothetical protein QF035_009035 [Streptomyces umbrinus]|uniref:Integral membrane protein n=1 Tax=Streptomyces umbrinus TaxID=67370 RepID=A0ABU0T6M8_9ACTN|nr:hypothetical protein [Streptomyces umbrinus]MDQ1031453.1 hypothetical protein [Streptomyces umbrinus]